MKFSAPLAVVFAGVMGLYGPNNSQAAGKSALQNPAPKPLLQQTVRGVTLRIWRARWTKPRELSFMASEPQLALEYDILAPTMKAEKEKSLVDYVLTANLGEKERERGGMALGDTKLFRSTNNGYQPLRPNVLPAGRGFFQWQANPNLEKYSFAWEWLVPGTTWDRTAPPTLNGPAPQNFRHFRFVLTRAQIQDFPTQKPLAPPLQTVAQAPYSLGLYRWTVQNNRAAADLVLKREPALPNQALNEPYIEMRATDQNGAKLEMSSTFPNEFWRFDGGALRAGEKSLHYEAELKPDTQSVQWSANLTERASLESAFALDDLPIPPTAEAITSTRESNARVVVRRIVRFDAEHPLHYPPRTSGPTLPVEGLAVLLDIVPASPAKFLKIKRAIARDDSGREISSEATTRFSFGYDLVSAAPTPGFHETVLLQSPAPSATKFNLRLRLTEYGEEKKFKLEMPARAVSAR